MGKRILVDTDVIIKSYRGDKIKYQQLKLIKNSFSISVITAIELMNGAKNFKQLASTKKELKAYEILHINSEVSQLVFQLFSKYVAKRNLQIPDLIIAATAISYDYLLYTDNKKHYDFIKELRFYKESSS